MAYGMSERRRRSGGAGAGSWSSWAPLAVTASVAAIGVAAWIWNERRQDDDEGSRPDRPYGGGPSVGGMFTDAPPSTYPGPGFPPGYVASDYAAPSDGYAASGAYRSVGEDDGIVNRVSGALRRTPSPQQIFDGASKRVVAGVAAAGAAVGGALASIREEDKREYEDHSRWSEETRSAKKSRRRPKRVAIIVSAENVYEHHDSADFHHEDASILSHLPEYVDESLQVWVLIYDPSISARSMSSSFSNIEGPEAESEKPRSRKYQSLYGQARTLVRKESMIVPFSSLDDYGAILHNLKIDTVYIQAALAGHRGDRLDSLRVSQLIVVVGDEGGHGGLVDSEDERGEHQLPRWWLDDVRIGLGKGIEVVEGMRLREDFERRVGGRD